ncbi:hypothetical protein ACFE04_007420 [Oxalis oulophora]
MAKKSDPKGKKKNGKKKIKTRTESEPFMPPTGPMSSLPTHMPNNISSPPPPSTQAATITPSNTFIPSSRKQTNAPMQPTHQHVNIVGASSSHSTEQGFTTQPAQQQLTNSSGGASSSRSIELASSNTNASQEPNSTTPNEILITPRIKKHIELLGKEFSLQLECVQAISSIIKSYYKYAWISWKKVPQTDRDMWFREFGDLYTWNQEETHAIRKVWETNGTNSMRNMLFRVRQANKNPPWIAEPVWIELLRLWATASYKKKRQQGSENRSSNCGGRGFPQYYGGNRTFLTHRKKLKEKTGEDPGIAGTFKKLNTTTKEDGEVVWRNDYYKDVYNNVAQNQTRAINTENNDVGDGTQTSENQPLTEAQAWLDATGGPNKRGRIPGLGGEAIFLIRGSSSSSKADKENEKDKEINGLKETVDKMQKMVDDLKANQNYLMYYGYYRPPGYTPPVHPQGYHAQSTSQAGHPFPPTQPPGYPYPTLPPPGFSFSPDPPTGPSTQPIQQPSSDHVSDEESDEEDDVTNDSQEESDTE